MSQWSSDNQIVFLNRFFWPDHSATAQILSDLAFHLAANGQNVCVITSRSRYDAGGSALAATEVARGVSVKRVWTTGFGRKHLLGRLADYLSYYVAATIQLWHVLRAGDRVVIMTDPPLLSIPAAFVVRLRRARLINWLQDVFPEVAERAGSKLAGGLMGGMLSWLRDRSLKRAELNVSIGSRMAEHIVRRGVDAEKSVVIPNWADAGVYVDREREAADLRLSWQFSENDIVVGYSGNLGQAHDVSTIIDAALRLKIRGINNIKFLFVGGGAGLAKLKCAVVKHGIESFQFRPYQQLDKLGVALRVPDIHWLSLKPHFEGLILPSKFYGIIASGRPVIFIGDPDGEVGTIIAASNCGKSCELGDSARLESIIELLASDAIIRSDMASCADSLAKGPLMRENQLNLWLKLLTA